MCQKHHQMMMLLCIISVMLLSCASGFRAPRMGVTDQFYSVPDRERASFVDYEEISLENYDFSKLQKGYGLFIYSYEFLFGESITSKYPDSKEGKLGIRVWEYKFEPGDWDIKQVQERVMFYKRVNHSTFGLLSSGFNITMLFEYRKNRIVYGGRIRIDFDTYFDTGPEVEFTFDEDMSGWLNVHADELEGIKIDTVLMSVGY